MRNRERVTKFTAAKLSLTRYDRCASDIELFGRIKDEEEGIYIDVIF